MEHFVRIHWISFLGRKGEMINIYIGIYIIIFTYM